MNHFQSGSSKFLKNMNQQHVLNLIRLKPGTTALKMNQETGLRTSTISYILKELKEWNIIREKGTGLSTKKGGKKPILWELCPNYGYLLGLSIHKEKIRIVLLDFSGRILTKKTYKIENQDIIPFIYRVVTDFINEQSIDENMILGLGISIMEDWDFFGEESAKQVNSSNEEDTLKNKLQPLFSFPLEICGDAVAGAYALKWFSREEKKIPNILYFTIGEIPGYFSIGMIIHHRLYVGADGKAGLGLNCGNIEPDKEQPIKDWSYEILTNDESCLYVMVYRLNQLLNPDRIIIGGEICLYSEELTVFIQKCNKRYCKEKDIVFISPFKEYTGAIGCAALIYQQFFV